MTPNPNVKVLGTTDEFDQFAAEEICRILNDAIRQRGVCSLALSGGDTPRRVYRRMGSADGRGSVDWQRVHYFFGDERAVPPSDPLSNFGMVERALLAQLAVPEKNVHRIKGELEPAAAAAEYERELRRFFELSEIRFDLVLLGVGEDGHTASLFPGTSVLDEGEALVQAVYVPRLNASRVTMTLRCINNARNIFFLATGAKKAPVLQQILGSPSPTKSLPATLIRPNQGTLHWIIDQEAAALLKKISAQPAPGNPG